MPAEMTDNQATFVKNLLAERSDHFPAGVDVVFNALVENRVTKTGASSLIEQLLRMEKNKTIVAAPAARRANSYAGRCGKCGNEVAAGAGYLTGSRQTGWGTEHKDGECPTVKVGGELDAILGDLPDGSYAVPAIREGDNDLSFFEIWTRDPNIRRFNGSDKRGVSLISGGDHHGTRPGVEWVKLAVAAVEALGVNESMALYARNYRHCSRCHRQLTDKTSRMYGLGPDCRGKLGVTVDSAWVDAQADWAD